MEIYKTDREIILETLRFIKENESGKKNYVNPKDSPEFSSLPKETQNRIRDIIVVNRLASISNIGKVWELAITWHPEGGVDILNKKNVKKILNEDGSFNIWYRGRQHLKKHLITIIVSVIAGVLGGIFLIWITPFMNVEKTESSKTLEEVKLDQQKNVFWTEFAGALENNDTKYLLSESLDSIQCSECNFIEGRDSEYYDSEFIFSDVERIKKLMHLNSLLDSNYSVFEDDERIIINYKIKSKMAPEGGYNLIFKFINTDEGKRFVGMIVT